MAQSPKFEGVQHPSEFSSTTVPDLSVMDNVMRCQICKDYFDTPMMTKCCHTFCSMCIRQALSATGICPTCRRTDQASNLRSNWPLTEAVACWKRVAANVLDAVSQKPIESVAPPITGPSSPIDNQNYDSTKSGKKRVIQEVDDVTEDSGHIRRSKRYHDTSAAARMLDMTIDDERDEDYIELDDASVTPAQAAQAAKAIKVSCPICNEEMLESLVFGHLDHCTGSQTPAAYVSSSRSKSTFKPTATELTTTKSSTSQLLQPPTRTQPVEKPAIERITFLAYDMLKEPQFKKKLQQLGITATGSKALMKKRHMYWVDLWNSNADSDNPKGRRELLKDLDAWERSLGGRSNAGQVHPTMQKEFDRQGYIAENGNQYKDLIAQARQTIKTRPKNTGPEKANPVAMAPIAISSRPTSSAPNAAASMFLSAASQLNADAAERAQRHNNDVNHQRSHPSLQHESSTSASDVRHIPMFQMQEQPFTDMDTDMR